MTGQESINEAAPELESLPPGLERQPHDALLIGDVIQFNNGRAELAAYTIHQVPAAANPASDSRTPLVALGRLIDDSHAFVADVTLPGLEKCDRVSVTDKPVARLLPRPQASSETVRVHRADGSMAETMAAVLNGEGQPWADVARHLVEHPSLEKFDIWIVGGAVRDALIGKQPKDINDLDLATTAPPTVIHSLMQSSGLFDSSTRFYASETGVVHVRRPDEEPYIQVATLKLAYRGASKRWDFGTDLEADLQHRDLTINALFYDPRNQLLVDPSGRGLSDLGVQPATSASDRIPPLQWSPGNAASPRQLVIPSIGDLSITQEMFLLQQFLRLLKAFHRYPEADFETARNWLIDHEVGLRELLAQEKVDKFRRPEARKKARAAVRARARNVVSDLCDAGVTRLGRFHQRAISDLAAGELGYLEDLIDLAVAGLQGNEPALRTRGSASRQPRTSATSMRLVSAGSFRSAKATQPAPAPVGTGLRFANRAPDKDYFELGPMVAELERPSPKEFHRTFGIELAGYKHARLPLLNRASVDWVLGVTDESSWYVETGNFDRPIPISQEDLEEILSTDRGGTAARFFPERSRRTGR